MPRPNPHRSLKSEGDLARRVAYERDLRGWSHAGLAERLTRAGCPIQASAIWKIENGQPRRRITVDEMLAFAEVFGSKVEDLLRPPELILGERVRALLDEMYFLAEVKRAAHDRIEEVFDRAVELLRAPRGSVEGEALKDWVTMHPGNPILTIEMDPEHPGGEITRLGQGELGGFPPQIQAFIQMLHEQAPEGGRDGEPSEAS